MLKQRDLLTGEIQQKEYAGNDGAFQNEQIGERPEVGSMLIQGLEKLTLLDTLFQFLRKRQGVLDGVCVTGGEPLIQHDIEAFLKNIKELGYAVKLDTNGSCPKKLKEVVQAGLVDYVAMDIKNSREGYAKTIGIEDYNMENVEESVQFLLENTVPYEFRTTVVREFHQRADFESIANWIQGAKRYYLQQFVDSGDLIGTGLHGYNKEIMEQALKIVENSVEIAELRGVS